MKLPALTRDEVRQVDKTAIEQFGIPGVVLMENAGRGAAEVIDRISPAGKILILAGKGNNAGDGYVIARHLQLAGRDVRIVSIVALEELSGDAGINAAIARHSGLAIETVTSREQLLQTIEGAPTIVDCLLGTGATGDLRGLYADAVQIANVQPAMRIAIDVPTGLDCDTGTASDPTFQADHTITFVASKVGFTKAGADAYVGVIHEVGIGAPQKLLETIAASVSRK